MTDLLALASRIEASTIPSRQLDIEIEEAIGPMSGTPDAINAPSYTASMSDILAQASDVHAFELSENSAGNWDCALSIPLSDGVACAATKVLAFGAAYLRAKAGETNNG